MANKETEEQMQEQPVDIEEASESATTMKTFDSEVAETTNTIEPEDTEERSSDEELCTTDKKEEDSEESDNYLQYLTEEYHRFRLVAIILGVLGFSTILICITLIQAGIIPNRLYGVIMSVGNLFIIIMAVVIFTRTRPFKKRIKQFSSQAKLETDNVTASDGEQTNSQNSTPDTDYIFKILERGVRTELIIDTKEYQKLRHQWLAVFIAAAVLAIVACVLYALISEANIIATFIMLAAFVLVVVGFYIDRTKMKPLRNQFAKSHNMTEFQMRNMMRDYGEQNNLKEKKTK